MKYSIIITAIMFSFITTAFGQFAEIDTTKSLEPQINKFLKNAKRDSSDKTYQQIFNSFYECFESDEGPDTPKMLINLKKMSKLMNDSNIHNGQLAYLQVGYIKSLKNPKNGLIWMKALKEEYFKVYNTSLNPFILLYEGEALINAGLQSEAHKHFIEFQKSYPNSVTAMCYIYQTEQDDNLAQTWLSILKKEHPNHWIVKKYKDE